jgi:hypothetical protein
VLFEALGTRNHNFHSQGGRASRPRSEHIKDFVLFNYPREVNKLCLTFTYVLQYTFTPAFLFFARRMRETRYTLLSSLSRHLSDVFLMSNTWSRV